jgi:hypothetical protein
MDWIFTNFRKTPALIKPARILSGVRVLVHTEDIKSTASDLLMCRKLFARC